MFKLIRHENTIAIQSDFTDIFEINDVLFVPSDDDNVVYAPETDILLKDDSVYSKSKAKLAIFYTTNFAAKLNPEYHEMVDSVINYFDKTPILLEVGQYYTDHRNDCVKVLRIFDRNILTLGKKYGIVNTNPEIAKYWSKA